MIKLTGVVLRFDVEDEVGDIFSKDGTNFKNPVYVTKEFSKDLTDVIGSAELTADGGDLIAEVNIFDNSELTPEILKLLNPAVFGRILDRDGKNIKNCEILGIGLCVNENIDERIKPLSIIEQ